MRLQFIFGTHNTEVTVSDLEVVSFTDYMSKWSNVSFVWFGPENVAINMREVLEIREMSSEQGEE